MSLILQSLLTLLLILVGPIVSYYFERPLLTIAPSTAKKLKFYRSIIFTQWLAAFIAILLLGPALIFFNSPNSLQTQPLWLRYALIVLLTAFFTLALAPYLNCIKGEASRAKAEAAFRRQLGKVVNMLPDSNPERRWFAAVSITAGVCEEILFRGFLTRYLTTTAFHLPLYAAVLITAVFFGLNHIYQGNKGIIQTAVVGLALSAIYLLTGNLFLCILLHALLDLLVVFVMRPSPPPQPTVESPIL